MTTQICNGMGVDSAALITAMLDGDRPMGCDVEGLVVVTAMTGDESKATEDANNEHLLPKLRAAGVRYVQLARAGWSETDGILVLSDSHCPEPGPHTIPAHLPVQCSHLEPYVMHMRGPIRLSDEMRRVATIPTTASRKCSYKFKGWVLDQWAKVEFGQAERRHIIGFAAEEKRRRDRDLTYVKENDGRRPEYPLIDWNWDREFCLAYLWEKYGIEWPRSCCSFCPYQLGDIAGVKARWRREPEQAALAVDMEARARQLNPRMLLFKSRSAAEVAAAAGLADVVQATYAAIAYEPCAIYEVRRVHRRKGDQRGPNGKGWLPGPDASHKGQVPRSLKTVSGPGSYAEKLAELKARQAVDGGWLEADGLEVRLWFRRHGEPYPSLEHYLAVGAAGVADKEEGYFDELWRHVDNSDEPRQLDLDDLFARIDMGALLAGVAE